MGWLRDIFNKPLGLGKLGKLFNDSQEAYTSLSRPSKAIVDQTITIRIRAFGQDKDKQAAWDKEWRAYHPEWGSVQQCTVSGFPIQIWTDLREVTGGLMFGTHLIGHELIHAIALKQEGIADPDTFATLK